MPGGNLHCSKKAIPLSEWKRRLNQFSLHGCEWPAKKGNKGNYGPQSGTPAHAIMQSIVRCHGEMDRYLAKLRFCTVSGPLPELPKCSCFYSHPKKHDMFTLGRGPPDDAAVAATRRPPAENSGPMQAVTAITPYAVARDDNHAHDNSEEVVLLGTSLKASDEQGGAPAAYTTPIVTRKQPVVAAAVVNPYAKCQQKSDDNATGANSQEKPVIIPKDAVLGCSDGPVRSTPESYFSWPTFKSATEFGKLLCPGWRHMHVSNVRGEGPQAIRDTSEQTQACPPRWGPTLFGHRGSDVLPTLQEKCRVNQSRLLGRPSGRCPASALSCSWTQRRH
jgi:hypothetical protein